MRREQFRMSRRQATALLERAPVVHLATTDEHGVPILKTVHGVVVEGWIAFHGAPAGEKTLAIGREAVVSAEEMVASIPSYFTDPDRACPATTLYRGVQVHGRLERVDDAKEKAAVLTALMHKLQPEGGHLPIDAEHPLYRRAIDGILVVRVSLEKMDGKAKLAQHKNPQERARLLQQLWARGVPGDAAAIDLVRAASPDTEAPPFLEAPEGVTLWCALPPDAAEEACALLADAYWNVSHPRARLLSAHPGKSTEEISGIRFRLAATTRASRPQHDAKRARNEKADQRHREPFARFPPTAVAGDGHVLR
jgi:nitroimidazol reductase NimA-like FMN-containing flavoprotein (pyridoxamine 5'-phosphate oxidase superfamily)